MARFLDYKSAQFITVWSTVGRGNMVVGTVKDSIKDKKMVFPC
jgi:hypothetical protein